MILQAAYALGLAVVFYHRGPSFAAWGLLANFAAFLAVCLAMDLAWLTREETTIWFAVIDCATGAVMALRGGLSRIIATGYAVTVPIYALAVVFGVSTDTTFAIVWAVVALQLLAVYFGTGSNHGRGNRRRRGAGPAFGGTSRGNSGMDGVTVALVSRRQ